MANSNIKLYYFDRPGRAELIRLILVWAGKEFEDIRIGKEKWPEIKPTTPFGQVPSVDIDGKKFGQSVAIANYFASVFDLYGKTHLDKLKIDQVIQLIGDFGQETGSSFRETDPVKKAEIDKKIKEETAPKYLGFLEKLLEQNNGQYFAGDNVSHADILLFEIVTGGLRTYTSTAAVKCPLVTALAERIGNNERIKAYKTTHS